MARGATKSTRPFMALSFQHQDNEAHYREVFNLAQLNELTSPLFRSLACDAE
jgi:hypothetical protein